jgi:putative membrane protein
VNPDSSEPLGAADATRRTHLANERTQLAWWRTGMTAIAVALAVGRVVPELNDTASQWPYTLTGAGFALYGVALFAYGTARARSVMRAVHAGRFVEASGRVITALTIGGIVLGLATFGLVLFD